MKRFTSLVFAVFACFMGFFLSCEKPPEKSDAQKNLPNKKIYLTFDDGPSPVTEQILNVLAAYGVKATFFLIGKNVQRYPSTFLRTAEDGHSVGIHSLSHEYKKIYSDKTALSNDVNDCLYAIKAVKPDFSTTLYRFPGGSFGLKEEIKRVPDLLGLTAVDWNASCRDTEISSPTKEQLIDSAINTAKGKDNVIMLLHDSSTKRATAEALPYIIEYFSCKGYAFFSL